MMVQNDLIVVKIALEHIADILELENLSFTIPWTQKMFLDEIVNENAVYFVAIYNGKVIGYAGMWIILGEGNVTNIAVHPEYRQKKVASKLIDALIDAYNSNDYIDGNGGNNSHNHNNANYENNSNNNSNIERKSKGMTLEVRAGNIPAINLYTSFGFYKEGIRKKYYVDNDEDAIIMWKKF